MTIVVIDANILIDLVKLKLLNSFFSLGFRFYTTDLILNELHDNQKDVMSFIKKGQLIVEEITEFQLVEINTIRLEKSRLSVQDCSAFYHARFLNATLITSDNTLRKFAKDKALDVHGHLWVFDQMVDAYTLDSGLACDKLDELCTTINLKLNLPKKEFELRKEKWQSE